MSDILQEIFKIAIGRLPPTSVSNIDKLENTLLESLGKDSISRFEAYKDALIEESWEDMQNLFFLALSLGIELAALTPSADACRR